MATTDWEASWKAGKIGFHSKALNPMLEKHASKILDGQKNCKVFVPLCGKSVDMKWFADQGHNAVGVEVVEMAITSFYEEQGIDYTKESVPKLPGATVYKSKDGKITLYNADIFSMTSDIIGKFDCIWDRASLVALNKTDRERYAPTLTSLMGPNCRYLLSVLDYDPSKAKGPPHNVPNSEVATLYESSCKIEKIDTSLYHPSKFAKDVECVQTLFLMKPK
ncbi:thiopurine S-methyltransferase-like [Anneissia japonica]|uniref:thiopurine S-methyltransferase-like n=1 Tax=Anneissia japonica TaxID=1529436 RepID=UPI001425B8B5|nr:thiopurine S-methyltransferase-like [Anneissia japonica]XP_033123923.1 thiopurine S-methyltransferase-like [Anneissia japonica]XP_033123924.1 thiopurine S-methyltransferase-like [Anneissia japonica]